MLPPLQKKLSIHLLMLLLGLFQSVLAQSVLAQSVLAQQSVDLAGIPEVASPRYNSNSGPRVVIDAGHNNFHTSEGRYRPFAAVLEADGYRVSSWPGPFTAAALQAADVLIIANALSAQQAADWNAAPASAFTAVEIRQLAEWVRGGGSLMLIADHMPFPAAAAQLARAFGFIFYDGYLLDKSRRQQQGYVTFSRADGSLRAHPIVDGSGDKPAIDSVTTFLGQAFLAPSPAQPLLSLGQQHYLYFPRQAGKISDQTTNISAETWLQGATLEYGQGRLAVFGEAAAFTAQTSSDGNKVGMNHPLGKNNAAFLLNTLSWLQP
jgi:hypothetical protein